MRRVTPRWGLCLFIYGGFIMLLSFLYPLSGDEYFPAAFNLQNIFYSYLTVTPRIGTLLSNITLFTGRWFFVALNPLAQLALAGAVFRVVFVRRPDFSDDKDLPVFVLICFLCVFAAAAPDQTIFWVSGACNYSWLMLAFMWFLFLLRKTYALGVKDTPVLRVGGVFFGFFIGMINENIGPLAPVICILFWFLYLLKRRRPPAWFWGFCAGLVCGLAALFISPAYTQRI
ncbi:MAG: DUF6056 family protein, partial [Elusimicrobiota bacterium]|nr:DUF6056 family protein [Elusimicrobiota bacterium]